MAEPWSLLEYTPPPRSPLGTGAAGSLGTTAEPVGTAGHCRGTPTWLCFAWKVSGVSATLL